MIGILPYVNFVSSGSPFPVPPWPQGQPQIYVIDDLTAPCTVTPATIAPIAAWGPQYCLIKVPGGVPGHWGGWCNNLLTSRRSIIVETAAASVPVWASALAGLIDFNRALGAGRATVIDTSLITAFQLSQPTSAREDIANSASQFLPGRGIE